ncbi:MAG: MerR family transcriptional regulator [Longimicrobiaceae bacterium]
MALNPQGRRRDFYTIGEVCERLGVKPHVLRYWETRFERLSPAKNRSGKRIYREEEIELIGRIHQLVHDQGYTVDGARRKLAEREGEGTSGAPTGEARRRHLLGSVREELERLRDLLDPA